jgi:hypothetical protein
MLAAGYGSCGNVFDGLMPTTKSKTQAKKKDEEADAIRAINAAEAKRARRQERNKKLIVQRT